MADDERRLVERLLRRDEAAFNELVRQHQGQVYRLLLRMLGDPAEAEDVAQEVFVSVFKAIESFRGDSALATWLYRIAANHAKNRIKYLARRARAAEQPLDELSEARLAPSFGARPDGPDQWVESKEAGNHMEQAFASLEAEQRLLLTLRDVENMSYEEIRQISGLPIGTVKSKLHRARMALHERFTELQAGKP
jgi:RNA polymerase sigma-70 factor (ECF subfamily)